MMTARVLALCLVAALAPASASAATTVGSDLSRPGEGGYCVGDAAGTRCTLLQLTLGTADQGVPVDGVITRWAVRDAAGELALRVIEGPAGQRHVVASGPAVQASGSGVQTFQAQIAVSAGQRIGVEVGESGYLPFVYRDEQTTGERYVPALGASPEAPIPESAVERTYEPLYNATVEPDADRDGLGDETQDPDRGGASGGGSTAGCPTSGVLARGSGSLVFRTGKRIIGCRDGQRTLIGTSSARTRFRLFRFNGDQLALVRVAAGKSSIQIFHLGDRRRTFSTGRTYSRIRSTRWTVTDLEVAPSGDAAWISTPRGAPHGTTVWVRHGARVQQIDQGRIRPTSLRLSADNTSINYTGADGRNRNSGFR